MEAPNMSGSLADRIFKGILGLQTDSPSPVVASRPSAFQFSFQDFEAIPINQCIGSAEFSCFGYHHKFNMWCLPNNADGEHLTCFLQSTTKDGEEANVCCEAEIICSDGSSRKMAPLDVNGVFQYPYRDVLNPKENVLSFGSLVVRVHLREIDPLGPPSPTFAPENPLCKAMLGFFLDEKSADIVFKIPGQGIFAKPEHFPAHSLILKACAPTLAELCEGDGRSVTHVTIPDVDPDTFRALLYYLYGGKVTSKLFKGCFKDAIDAADRYNILNLKVEAEVCYVKNITLTMDNVVDNYYFADNKKCPLLKEKVMEYILDHRKEVLEMIPTQDLPYSQDMLNDILAALTKKETRAKRQGCDDPYKFKTMSINSLRRALHARGLGVDGTREMLVAALEQSVGGSTVKVQKITD